METIFLAIFLILVLIITIKTLYEERGSKITQRSDSKKIQQQPLPDLDEKNPNQYSHTLSYEDVKDFNENDFLKTKNNKRKIKDIHDVFNQFAGELNNDEYKKNRELIMIFLIGVSNSMINSYKLKSPGNSRLLYTSLMTWGRIDKKFKSRKFNKNVIYRLFKDFIDWDNNFTIDEKLYLLAGGRCTQSLLKGDEYYKIGLRRKLEEDNKL